jgi:hypothetical protein
VLEEGNKNKNCEKGSKFMMVIMLKRKNFTKTLGFMSNASIQSQFEDST